MGLLRMGLLRMGGLTGRGASTAAAVTSWPSTCPETMQVSLNNTALRTTKLTASESDTNFREFPMTKIMAGIYVNNHNNDSCSLARKSQLPGEALKYLFVLLMSTTSSLLFCLCSLCHTDHCDLMIIHHACKTMLHVV